MSRPDAVQEQRRDPAEPAPVAAGSRRRAVRTLIAAAVFVVVAAGIGATTPGSLVGGGALDPASEATRASEIVIEEFPTARPNAVVVLEAGPQADAAALAAVARRVDGTLAALPDMLGVQSYRSSQDPRLRSPDGRSEVALLISAVEPDMLRAEVDTLQQEAAGQGVDVRLGGPVEIDRAIDERTMADLLRSEAVAIPLLILVLLWAFRGPLAASLPLGLGLMAVAGSLLVLRVVAEFTSVSVFALNVCTALGLGLAVDYSLLVLHRFREELAAGRAVPEALAVVRATAVRTVVFSAVVVALSLSGLVIFPQYFIRSMAYAAIAVVVLTAIGAVVVLPAALLLLGERLAPRRRASAAGASARWYRWSDLVVRHRIVALAVSTALLALLALPVTGLRSGLPDDRQLPPGTEASTVQQALRSDFPGLAAPLSVVWETGAEPADPGAVRAYGERLAALPGVDWVEGPFGLLGDAGTREATGEAAARFTAPGRQWISVGSSADPNSTAAQDLVSAVRAVPAPAPALVGGPAADVVDAKASVLSTLPWAVGVVVVITFLVLFLLSGGLLLPLKALLLNVLSLAATLGVLIWGFQEGAARGWVGDFQVTGYLDVLVLVLVGGVTFALAMDYEVFLVARIREEYLRTGDTVEAVRRAQQHTGQVVTIAAALIAVVFLGLGTSSVFDLKVMGIGLLIGILLDATIVRGVMVPAFIAVAGRANWWAPRALRRIRLPERMRE